MHLDFAEDRELVQQVDKKDKLYDTVLGSLEVYKKFNKRPLGSVDITDSNVLKPYSKLLYGGRGYSIVLYMPQAYLEVQWWSIVLYSTSIPECRVGSGLWCGLCSTTSDSLFHFVCSTVLIELHCLHVSSSRTRIRPISIVQEVPIKSTLTQVGSEGGKLESSNDSTHIDNTRRPM